VFPIVLIIPNCTKIFSGVSSEQKKLGSEIFEYYVGIHYCSYIRTEIILVDVPSFQERVPVLYMRPVVEDRLGNETIKTYPILIMGSFMDPLVSHLSGKRAFIITIIEDNPFHDSSST
jgi:hypothetical protein